MIPRSTATCLDAAGVIYLAELSASRPPRLVPVMA